MTWEGKIKKYITLLKRRISPSESFVNDDFNTDLIYPRKVIYINFVVAK